MGKRRTKPATFTDEIRDAIRQCGLTQYRLCEMTGIDKSLMSRFLAGQSGLSCESLDRVALAIGLHVTTTPAKGP